MIKSLFIAVSDGYDIFSLINYNHNIECVLGYLRFDSIYNFQ